MKGFRTYIIAVIVAIFGVLEMTDWSSFLDNPKAGAVALGSAILMAILRSVTTTPPGSSTPPPTDPKV
jgi:hypothetical protein